MCIIAVKQEGVDLPLEKHLRNCEIRNKDGMGIALLKYQTNEIVVKKDFENIDAFIMWFYANVKKEDTCIVHFRYATHGLVDVGNRHPFPVTKNKELLRQAESICKMVVAHNGVISNYGHHATFSDTQKFIVDILADEAVKTNLESDSVRKLISNFIGTDRLVVLNHDKTIYLWGTWEKEKDVYYSNDGYKEVEVPRYWNNYPTKLVNGNWVCDIKDEHYGYQDVCDGCGSTKKTNLYSNKQGAYFALCRSCRKKMKKGKLNLGSLEQFGQSNKEEEIGLTKLEELHLSEEQCENCFEWYEKEQITKYYGANLCRKCLMEVCEITHIKTGEEK